ncbi:amidohydrolase family protein [Nocardioides acrostichi]|uniref:Peptidase n=1 Tax=Nocardioides acrostichi TaxID=2784339 RepID=A0A930YCA0_9ACTN|nr:hypothetical protein [Nocardioides acrostichi]MBF4161274.1 hypothetical protein [Nocardioides acrostichi]
MRPSLRLALAAATAAGLIGGALVATGTAGPVAAGDVPRVDLRTVHEVDSGQGLPLVTADGERIHVHAENGDKNAISRAVLADDSDQSVDVSDPTTPAERVSAENYVERERERRDPRLTTAPITQKRRLHPQDRYALASGCYSLVDGGEPLYFKATDLGTYLIQDADSLLLAAGGERTSSATSENVWTARGPGRRLRFAAGGSALEIGGANVFAPTRTSGCSTFPESQISVSGRPHAGVTPYQEVRGYVDAHTHGMAFEFLGGDAHCGRPWDPFGVTVALVDCPDHTYTDGYGALLETALSGKPGHDPVGWPTFKDWPAPDSLTHEGTYYRWLERSWRGGQRIFVNLLVENNQLCQLYPIKHNSCDDMDSIRLQAADMYAMQDYIDAQFGGPGKGFYRIVKNPFQARRVINRGKLAVIMGIETSVPFGCTFKSVPGVGDVPACDAADIDKQLDEVHALGVRQMELVNKFDNALSGITGDNGSTGVLVNGANFLETGTFWDMQHCEPADGESSDHEQYAAPTISAEQQDALFGAVAQVFGAASLPAVPLYPPPAHCNSRGLTTLGEHTIAGLAARKMIFDPDHMSVKARSAALDQIDAMGYHGVISSHSWSTPDAYPRVYADGGTITPYAGDSTGFVAKWRRHLGWADSRYYYGIGYGADINGLGAQGDPRGADVPNPVTYPFEGLGGVTIKKQHAGERVYDINVDGVAQYGLYPDWIEDLRKIADAEHAGDGAKIVADMERGPEAYLQMWERAYGIAPDSCRNPGERQSLTRVKHRLGTGMSTTQVMRAVGQPTTRLAHTFGFCAKNGRGGTVHVKAVFDASGHLRAVRS